MIFGPTRLETGVPNLDAIFHGGVPCGSLIAISGSPGSGKTILAQQICFHHATDRDRVLYFGTLSEPTAKLLRNLGQFSFFDRGQFGTAVEFVDLGDLSRLDGLAGASELITKHIERVQPSIIVIDSFKIFDDLARSRLELRTFGYRLAVELMAWEATTFLVGEYGDDDLRNNPILSMIDGLWVLSQRHAAGDHQRFFQIVKMRGSEHSRTPHAFRITHAGIELFAPHELLALPAPPTARVPSGVAGLDPLLGGGLLERSVTLVSGSSGIGKTTLAIQFVLAGAERGEPGLLVTLDESADQLLASAGSLELPLAAAIDRGAVSILQLSRESSDQFLTVLADKLTAVGARRVAIDAITHLTHHTLVELVARFKVLGVTSLLALDAASLYSAELITEGSLLPIADNLLLLRYRDTEDGLMSTLSVIKTRGSPHAHEPQRLFIGIGGMTVGPALLTRRFA